eukprot:5594158-Amphidinium_carterae.1
MLQRTDRVSRTMPSQKMIDHSSGEGLAIEQVFQCQSCWRMSLAEWLTQKVVQGSCLGDPCALRFLVPTLVPASG